ncbi:MAG: alpha/beta fold hydrolase [Luminiphilus sp.]|nr:alpha/beta fold hydrolase [Luminiphilus sp.]
MSEGLQVRLTGKGDKPLVLLHGLFGSGQNLGQLARGLADSFAVYSVDLPDHGRSPWSDACSIDSYADILIEWLTDTLAEPVRLMGHSLGGKVAMAIARQNPELVAELVILDIAAVDYPSRHDSVFRALRAVEQARLASRSEARTLMTTILDEPRIADFLLTNVVIDSEEGLHWRFNLDGIQSGYPNLLVAGDYPHGFTGPTLLLRGAQSDYVTDESIEKMKTLFPLLSTVTIDGAGHWLHQEQTESVLEAMRTFLVQ